jgi:hypothetical protein
MLLFNWPCNANNSKQSFNLHVLDVQQEVSSLQLVLQSTENGGPGTQPAEEKLKYCLSLLFSGDRNNQFLSNVAPVQIIKSCQAPLLFGVTQQAPNYFFRFPP